MGVIWPVSNWHVFIDDLLGLECFSLIKQKEVSDCY